MSTLLWFWILLAFLIGSMIGLLTGILMKYKPEGKVKFYLAQIDDDLNGVQCSVSPDRDWTDILQNWHKDSILFQIERDPNIKEAIEKNKFEKEN